MGSLGDRRQAVRFEIIGELWGTVTTTHTLPLVNLSDGGVLIESARPLPVGSVQRSRLAFDFGASDIVETVVKHVKPAAAGRYLVGMAFVDLSAEARARIDAFITSRGTADGGAAQA